MNKSERRQQQSVRRTDHVGHLFNIEVSTSDWKAPHAFAMAEMQMDACSVSVANIRLLGTSWRLQLLEEADVSYRLLITLLLTMCASGFKIVGKAGDAHGSKEAYPCFDRAGCSAREPPKQMSWRSCSSTFGWESGVQR